MSLFEIIYFALRIVACAAAMVLLWSVHPLIAIMGAIITFLGFPACVRSLVGHFGDAPRKKPVCINKICNDPDYRWVRSIENIPVCKCKCEVEYAIEGRNFYIVGPDDTMTPYMIWMGRQGWQKAQ